ncbi:MAG: spermidine synthase [Betaproteobacteria bacterium]
MKVKIDAPAAVQRTLFLLFGVSGFCGLIYESIWAYYLKLFVGHAAYAQTVVLVVFIGGMSIGAWAAGRMAGRTANPLLSYAVVEAIVGIFALAFQWIFTTTTDWAYASLLPAYCSAEGLCAPQWLLAGLLILPQSILLGTTFPLMSAGILRAFPATPGRSLSMLYFTNSLGAVFGVLASTFILIPAVGLPGTTQLAGMTNIVLAIIVALFARRFRVSASAGGGSPRASTQPAPGISPQTATAAVAPLLLVAALTGLSSFIYEIVWIRMLGLVLGSSTHAFELMLSSFILGLALGGYWIKFRIDRTANVMRLLAIVQIIMGALAFATLPIYNEMFDLMAWFLHAMAKNEDGYVLFNIASKLIAILVMFPATFMAGMTLPLITYHLLRSPMGERSIGYVYAANTTGAIIGVILTVHLLLPQLGLKGALVTGALIDIALGWLLFARYCRTGPDVRYSLGWSVAGGIVALTIGLLSTLDPARLASGVYRLGTARLGEGTSVIFHRDGKTATIDVIRSQRQSHLFIRTNGKTDAAIELDRNQPPSTDEVTMVMTAAIPLAVRPDAQSAAIIGFGSGVSTHTLLASPALKRVDTIEIEAAMVEGAQQFRPRNERAYSDPRSHILIDDAKAFFARSSSKYDIIVSEPSNPWVSGVSSLFSDEFYARIRNYLTDSGVLVQWIQIYEIEPHLVESIVRALGKHFPNYAVYAADEGNLLLVATPSAAPITLSNRIFELPLLAPDLRHLGIGHMGDITPRYIAGSKLFSQWIEDGIVNSDYYPYVDLNAARSRFMRADAVNLVAPRGDNLPVMEILEAKIWDSAEAPTPIKGGGSFRHELALLGEDVVNYLLRPETTETPTWMVSAQAASLHAVRGMLLTCEKFADSAMLWDEVISVANTTVATMSSARQKPLWDAFLGSACYPALTPVQRDWLQLIALTGARDAPGMARLGEKMLAEDAARTNKQWTFLVTATATSLLATGQPVRARETLVRNWKHLDQQSRDWPTMELLLRLSQKQ